MVPTEVRLRAAETRDAARKLVMQRYQSSDHADVLMRQAEAAVAALRSTMRQVPDVTECGGTSAG